VILEDVKKILILRTDGIGDLLNSTPAISVLRQNYSDSHITVLASTRNAEMLLNNPDIDEVLIYDKRKRLRERFQFLLELRRMNFDLTVAMYTSSWCNFVMRFSRAKYRVGRYQKRFKRTLTHPHRKIHPKGTVHETVRNLELVKPICDSKGASMSEKPLRLFEQPQGIAPTFRAPATFLNSRLVLNLSSAEKQWAQNWLRQVGISEGDFLAGVHPGASSFDKIWHEPSYAQVSDMLINQYGAKILILCSTSESELASNILNNMTNEAIIHVPTSLRQLTALINECALFICNDSGPMHIAAALNIPTVAIFGPTDHFRWAPFSENATIAIREMPCRPCSAHKCRREFECIKHLPVETVWEKVKLLLL